MKKFLVIGSAISVLALLIISLTTPVFAHDPTNDGTGPANNEAHEEMHKACTEGDWEAMIEAAEELHGEDFSSMMGGGMMGGGWGMTGSRYR